MMPEPIERVARVRARAFAALVGAVLAPVAWGVDRAWVGGSGTWSTAGNWSPSGVPAASDHAIVTTSATVERVLTYDYAGPAVTLSTLRLDNTGTILPPSFMVLSIGGNFPPRSLSANIEYVGYNGRGRINQSGTTFNAADFLYIGYNSGGRGVYSLSGVAGLNTLNTYVGYLGSGTLTAASQSVHTAVGETHLGYDLGTSGVYNLSSMLSASGNIHVGRGGHGVLNMTGGSLRLSNGADLFLGSFADGTGTMNLSGGRLHLTTAESHVYVGELGTASVIQSGSAHVETAGDLFIGNTAGATGHYVIHDEPTLLARTLFVGRAGTGTFVQNGGFHSVSTHVIVGSLPTGRGTYTLTGGTLRSAREASIGNQGTGEFHHSGGTFTVVSTGERLSLGSTPGSQGSYHLSGAGYLTVDGTLVVGLGGKGTFSQTGGSVLVTGGLPVGSLAIGQSAGSQGAYLLSNDAVLEVRDFAMIGRAESATFTQHGGTFVVSNSLLALAYDSGSSASYLLTGGTLFVSHFGSVTVGRMGTATFTQTGGSHTIQGMSGLSIAAGSLTAAYTFAGGHLAAPLIEVGANGQFLYTGGTLAASEFRLTGGKVALNNNAATRIHKLHFLGTTDEWRGQLDLHASALVLQTTSPSDKAGRIPVLLNQIASGRAGGTWTGQGITSSAIPGSPTVALALVDNGDLGLSSLSWPAGEQRFVDSHPCTHGGCDARWAGGCVRPEHAGGPLADARGCGVVEGGFYGGWQGGCV